MTTSAGKRPRRLSRRQKESRRGAVLVFCGLVLLVMFYMAAFAIDVGFIVLSRAELQNATDAACLAATLELGAALETDEIEANAKSMAVFVAGLNTVAGEPLSLNPAHVELGERSSDGTSVFGGDGPYNAVRVTGHRDEANGSELGLYWARVIGHHTADIEAVSLGVLTPRDLAFVLDNSGSMCDDTSFNSSLSQVRDEAGNMTDVFDDLFGDATSSSETPTVGSGNFPGYLHRYDGSTDATTVWRQCRRRLMENTNIPASQRWDLDRWFPGGSGTAWWNATPPSSSTTAGKYWRAYVAYISHSGGNSAIIRNVPSHARYGTPDDFWRVNNGDNGTYWCTNVNGRRWYYGRQTFVEFLLDNGIAPIFAGNSSGNYTTYDLYAGSSNGSLASINNLGVGAYVRAQPVHGVRLGAKVGISAVQSAGSVGSENDFDRVSVSTFGTRGTWLASDDSTIVYGGNDIATSPVHLLTELTNDYDTARDACDYLRPRGFGGPGMTNIGDAIQDGVWLLTEGNNSREFSNKAIALLTDGQPTAGNYGSFSEMPAGSWNGNQRWALYNAYLAAEQDIRIHTIGLGEGADPALMGAIADMTGGEFYDLRFVTPANRQAAINDAFETIGKDRLGKLFRFTAPD